MEAGRGHGSIPPLSIQAVHALKLGRRGENEAENRDQMAAGLEALARHECLELKSQSWETRPRHPRRGAYRLRKKEAGWCTDCDRGWMKLPFL